MVSITAFGKTIGVDSPYGKGKATRGHVPEHLSLNIEKLFAGVVSIALTCGIFLAILFDTVLRSRSGVILLVIGVAIYSYRKNVKNSGRRH